MILPPLQGHIDQQDFFVYVAADRAYFEKFGIPLINSVIRNTTHGIHVHIYDPTSANLEFCRQARVSVSWENTSKNQFDTAIHMWSRNDLPEPYMARKQKMLGLKQFQDNENLASWIRKTYYACMRFVRLAELLDRPRRLLEIDIDGIVRSSFATRFDNDADHDIYIYEKSKRDKITGQLRVTGHLAGSILFTDKSSSMRFAQDLGTEIKAEIENDNLYWFLDQDSLDRVIVNYRKGILPLSYIDWHMNPASAIWTAKGRRKDLAVFQRELDRYQ